MNVASSSTSSWLSPPAGSSSRSSRGSETSARASSTRFSVPNGRPAAAGARTCVDADDLERLERLCAHARARLEARDGVRADEHVLEHGHRREELDVLERARDPELDHATRRRAQQGAAVEDDVAGVEPVEARDRVEGRRLAGAVRPDQADDRALLRPRSVTSSSATMPPKRRDAFWSERRPIAAARLYGFRPRASRYSRQSCSIVVDARRGDVRRVVRRVVDRAHDEGAVAVDVEDVDAARRLLEAAQERAVAGQRRG